MVPATSICPGAAWRPPCSMSAAGAGSPRPHLPFALLIHLKLNNLRQREALVIQGFSSLGLWLLALSLWGNHFPVRKLLDVPGGLSAQAVLHGSGGDGARGWVLQWVGVTAAGQSHSRPGEGGRQHPGLGRVGDSIFSPLPFSR